MNLCITGQSDSKKTRIEFSIFSSHFHIKKFVVFVTAQYERDQEDENEKHFASAKIHRCQSHRAHVSFTAPYDPERLCFLLPLLDSREIIDNDSLDYLKDLVLREKVHPAPAEGVEPSERQYIQIGTFYDYPRLSSLGKLVINTMLASHATPDQDAVFHMKVAAYLKQKQKYGEDVDDDWNSYTTNVWNRCDEPLALWGERLVAEWKKVRIV
jgi:hypothetical protein